MNGNVAGYVKQKKMNEKGRRINENSKCVFSLLYLHVIQSLSEKINTARAQCCLIRPIYIGKL